MRGFLCIGLECPAGRGDLVNGDRFACKQLQGTCLRPGAVLHTPDVEATQRRGACNAVSVLAEGNTQHFTALKKHTEPRLSGHSRPAGLSFVR